MNKHPAMKTIPSIILGLVVFLSSPAFGQPNIEPEQCILDTLKSAPPDSAAMVRWNCVHMYIKAVEARATPLPLGDFTTASLQWFASIPAIPDPLPEHIIVTLKNNSASQIISADIIIINRATKKQQTYRAYADYPIDHDTVGSLETEVMTGFSGGDFGKRFQWGFSAVYGVTP